MSLIPAFEIGFWNAWIFAVPYLWVSYGLGYLIVDRKATLFIWPSYTKSEKRYLGILMVTFWGPLIYSIFLPVKLDMAWFYVSLPIYLLGVIFVTMAMLSFSTTPLDEPVTKGIYRISRHPMNFGFFLALIGMGIASASWVLLLCVIVFIIVQGKILEKAEERMCLDKYDDTYREYMGRTPRWLGIPRTGDNTE
ncbi:methyltransferase family protein [Chloroflexota bacterium]